MDQPASAATDDTLAFQKRLSEENKSKLILAVDDDSETLAMLASIGNRAGYTVFIATSGEECLSMLWRVTPQLIMLDVKMPGLDGFETCRRIRSDPNVAHVAVAFLTARKTVEDLKRGVAVGGDDFLVKPFNATQLLERIEHLISRGHLITANRARRSSKIGPPTEVEAAPSEQGPEPLSEARTIRMVTGATGRGAKSIEIESEAKPNPRSASSMAARAERCSLRQIAAAPLTPFLAPDNMHKAPGLVSTSVLPLWWDALMAIAHDQLTMIQADLDRLLPLDDAIGLEALAQTLRGVVASLTGRLVTLLADAKPSSPQAVKALARIAAAAEIKLISEILLVAGPLDGAIAAFTRAIPRDGSALIARNADATSRVADLSPPLVSEAKKCYTKLGDGGVAGRLFVLAILNRLDKPWQIFRLARALSWKRDATVVSRTELAVIGDRLFFNLDDTALAVDNATAKLKTAAAGAIDLDPIIALVARYTDTDEGLLKETDIRRDSPWGAALLRARAKMCTALDEDRLQRVADAILAPVQDAASSAWPSGGDMRDDGTSRKAETAIANAAVSVRFLTYVAQRGDKHGFGSPARRLLEALREEVAARIETVLDQLRSNPLESATPDYLDQAVKLVEVLYSKDKRGQALGGRLRAALKGD
jgi:CheY-like chemotaxis protein